MHAKLNQLQIQKQILSPNMQQSIEVLMLSLRDLETVIEEELEDNPLLEIKEEEQPPATAPEPTLSDAQRLEQHLENLQNQDTRDDYQQQPDEEYPEESPMTRTETLEEGLLQQMRVELSDPTDIRIGEFIIGNIDEDGYLKITCEEIAKTLGITDLTHIEKILKVIQTFEPPGIATRDLKECLLVQAKIKFKDSNELILKILNNYLDELGGRKYALLAKNLGIPVERIKEVAKLIASLDPKPARNYRQLRTDIYIKPDVYITHSEDAGYQIQLNNENLPTLRVNPLYRNMLRKGNLSPEERAFIRDKLQNALYFIKSVEQRGQTIRAITQFIVEKQKDFFANGHMSLVPMNLKDVAQAVQRNESTVSRAIHNKYVDTPQGLYPFKFFFSQGVGQGQDNPEHDVGTTANRSIKEEIKNLVQAEDKSHPLSDQDIQKYFVDKGMTVARRTINKYRQALNILPSNLRKK